MFCSKCGKELPDDALFCQFCGNKVAIEENKEKLSEEIKRNIDLSKKEENNKGGILAGTIGLFLLIFLIIGFGGSDSSDTTTTKKTSCPSVAEMEDAITLYKDGGIIYSFNPELNTVQISSLAEKQFNYDDYKTLGYITACYSGYKKGNNLNWVEIYSAKNNKKIAKYSESYGFNMY